MKRRCRWCSAEFSPVNELRYLCDSCHGWATNDLGMKRAKRYIVVGKPRRFEALHRDIERTERAEDRKRKAEIALAQKIDAIREMRDAILNGRAGSYYHGKSRRVLERFAAKGR